MRRISIWWRVLEFLWPALKRERERRLRDGIRWLVRHPEVQVNIR